MDQFEAQLSVRLEALEAAAPVRPAPLTRGRRHRPVLRWLAAAAAAAVVAGVALAMIRPSGTEAATRTVALDPSVTATVRTNGRWTGTVDRDAAANAVLAQWAGKIGQHPAVTLTGSWPLAATVEVKGDGWSMSWSGPSSRPLDVWVVEFAGTSAEGWPLALYGVVDAHSGRVVGGQLSQQIPPGELNQDPKALGT